jgi:hypothetical protein
MQKSLSFRIRQEPLRGKLCTVHETPNTTFLYPSLVVQLEDSSDLSDISIESLNLVCHASLYDADGIVNQDNISSNTERIVRLKGGNTVIIDKYQECISGHCVVSPSLLVDPQDGNRKLFFIFSDLCIRMKGTFRILCHVINMDEYESLIRPLKEIMPLWTSPFEVYPVYLFPGPGEETQLSKSFWLQGIYY